VKTTCWYKTKIRLSREWIMWWDTTKRRNKRNTKEYDNKNKWYSFSFGIKCNDVQKAGLWSIWRMMFRVYFTFWTKVRYAFLLQHLLHNLSSLLEFACHDGTKVNTVDLLNKITNISLTILMGMNGLSLIVRPPALLSLEAHPNSYIAHILKSFIDR